MLKPPLFRNIVKKAESLLTVTTAMANLGTSKGLLELYHIPADSSVPYTSGNDYPSGVGFGHIGFTVPNVADAIDRVRSFGYEVIKPLDQAKEEQMGVPKDVVEGQYGNVDEGYKHVFRQLAFVKDPDVSWTRIVKGSLLMQDLGILGRAGATGCAAT